MADDWVAVLESTDAAAKKIANRTRAGAGGTEYQQEVVVGAQRVLLDYAARVDGNPVYVGSNNQQAVVADATWAVQRLSYDVTSRLVDTQILYGSWTGRAALSWRSAGGD